jgi:hypothetical protein
VLDSWPANGSTRALNSNRYVSAPIRDEPEYVLGKRSYERLPADNNELIYQSSNGDTWSLARDPATGAPAVMHCPNPQSGGQPSYVSIEKFLAEGANGPEHQALRRLFEANSRTATILIAYDVHPPKGAAYEKLVKAIQSLGSWWHHLETIWIVRSDQSVAEIRDLLSSHIGIEDQLLVIDISGDIAGWAGVNDAGSNWLNENIRVRTL